jgi:hypothetical protein
MVLHTLRERIGKLLQRNLIDFLPTLLQTTQFQRKKHEPARHRQVPIGMDPKSE